MYIDIKFFCITKREREREYGTKCARGGGGARGGVWVRGVGVCTGVRAERLQKSSAAFQALPEIASALRFLYVASKWFGS